VSDYELGDRVIEVRSPAEAKGIFPLASVSRPALGPTQPSVQWVPGVVSPGSKTRPVSEADYSPPSSAEVVSGSYIYPLPPNASMGFSGTTF
jgi:hypothetical protein